MERMCSSTTILLICLLFITIAPLAKAEEFRFIDSFCTNSSNFDLNNTYNTSINTLLHSFTTNATANPIGYFSISVGNTSENTIHGYYLCRGDLDNAACRACVSTMVTDRPKTTAAKYCPASKRETIFYDKCMYRYSNEILHGKMVINFFKDQESGQDITVNQDDFQEVLRSMFGELASKAANNQTGKKYATTTMRLSALRTLYALVQCTPDLSVIDCRTCLNFAVWNLGGRDTGENFMTPTCNIRYEVYKFFEGAGDLPISLSLANVNSGKKNISTGLIIGIVAATTAIVVVLITLGICFMKKIKVRKYDTTSKNHGEDITIESLQYDFAVLQSATKNFSNDNILGEGGFGIVYKGTLWDGQDIAVKRSSRRGHQGEEEFKNEVLLVAMLQHRNLVRLLGFCLTEKEQLLIYEYVPNKSLDRFLFEQEKDKQLDWRSRYNIIRGIARGMLYLHEDSRLKIIHRDLKASNILLDAYMNPKVSDFGTARIFEADQTQDCTNRVVGTYGYMAPEYVMHGMFSVQSDVYSFGILVLEIISGRRAYGFFQHDGEPSLKNFAWKHWRDGTPLEFVDPCIRDETSMDEIIRCMNLGLLSVQDADRRPSMSTIVLMLNSFSATIPVPMPDDSNDSDNNVRMEPHHLTKNSTCQPLDDDAFITMPR